MRQVTGQVTQINRENYGIKLDAFGDAWLDWSKFSDANTSGNYPMLTKGMRVTVNLDDKKNFIMSMTGVGGEVLPTVNAAQAAASANGHEAGLGRSEYRGITSEDSWRMTLLSTLRASVDLVSTMSDEQLGGRKRTDATYDLALAWARKAWAEPMPAPPAEQQ